MVIMFSLVFSLHFWCLCSLTMEHVMSSLGHKCEVIVCCDVTSCSVHHPFCLCDQLFSSHHYLYFNTSFHQAADFVLMIWIPLFFILSLDPPHALALLFSFLFYFIFFFSNV
jgi:hypothetical protein